MKRLVPIAVAAGLLLTSCGPGDNYQNVIVSVIGREARLRDPANGALGNPDAALAGAVAQGLVRLDASGQIEPGLAMRWAISDDGLYYTFRLNGRSDAERVAQRLRRLVERHRSGSFSVSLDAVKEIVAVTPEVIEIRLSAPRAELMPLLGSPSLAVFLDGKGTGPLMLDKRSRPPFRLRLPPAITHEQQPPTNSPDARRLLFRGERVGLAVARYASGQSSLVTGGGFDDFLYTRIAQIPAQDVQLDPANGLFGFRIASGSLALAPPEVRQALSMALDRDAIGAALGIGTWRPQQSILPPGLTDIPQPTRPFWARAIDNVAGTRDRALAAHVEAARRTIAVWRGSAGAPRRLRLTIAMPVGPGSAILFAAVRSQWRQIGVEAVRVGPRDAADLKLVDIVAPVDQSDWFLAQFLCAQGRPCSDDADQAFRAAREARDPDSHARLIARTEQQLAAIAPFIPLAQPVRWSLASPNLPGFRLNARAVHPLYPLLGNQSGH